MNTKSLVSHYLSGKLCNNVLQKYRAFWFAYTHGIPFSNVMFGTGTYAHHRIFDTIRSHIIPNDEYPKVNFNIVLNCTPRTFNIRKELFDLRVTESDNVSFLHGSFLYPELPWEHALFLSLYDNPPLRSAIVSKYGDALSGNTVGYTVRRTDFLHHHIFYEMKEDEIVSDLQNIITRFYGMVRIVMTSDDISFVRAILDKHPDIAKHVYLFSADEDITIYLLSMCDYVVSNGEVQCSWSWTNHPHTLYSSTFGQVAQILNRSYRYAYLKNSRMDPILQSPGISEAQKIASVDEKFVSSLKNSAICRNGCEYAYPIYIP